MDTTTLPLPSLPRLATDNSSLTLVISVFNSSTRSSGLCTKSTATPLRCISISSTYTLALFSRYKRIMLVITSCITIFRRGTEQFFSREDCRLILKENSSGVSEIPTERSKIFSAGSQNVVQCQTTLSCTPSKALADSTTKVISLKCQFFLSVRSNKPLLQVRTPSRRFQLLRLPSRKVLATPTIL